MSNIPLKICASHHCINRKQCTPHKRQKTTASDPFLAMELATGGTTAGKFGLFLLFLAMELATGGTTAGKFGLFLLFLANKLVTGGKVSGTLLGNELMIGQKGLSQN